MTSLTHLTSHDDLLALKFANSLPELIKWDQSRVRDFSGLILIFSPDINHQGSSCLSSLNLIPLGVRGLAIARVVTHVSGLVNGIFCAAKSRSISKFEIHQVVDCQPGIDCGGDHVNTLIDTIQANCLSTQ